MKILALILAGGQGSRVNSLYNEDEPNKAMLKIGNERLIEKSLNSLPSDREIDIAVLSNDGEKYNSLNKLLAEKDIKVLTQFAKQRKLPMILELPYILLWQFHFSKDKNYLKKYDAIITIPCDVGVSTEDYRELIDRHIELNSKKALTILSKPKEENERGDYFLLDGNSIKKFKSKKPKDFNNGWVRMNQAGVYIFSKKLLVNPLLFIGGLKCISPQMVISKTSWLDYGDIEVILNCRDEPSVHPYNFI